MPNVNGKLVILVPCRKFPYDAIDKNRPFRRNLKKMDLEATVRKKRFTMEKCFILTYLECLVGTYGNVFKNSKANGIGRKIFYGLASLPILGSGKG